MIYELGNQGYVTYINNEKRESLGRKVFDLKAADLVITSSRYRYKVMQGSGNCLGCDAHKGGSCLFAFTELGCRSEKVILKEDPRYKNRKCMNRKKFMLGITQIYDWKAWSREVCVVGAYGYQRGFVLSQFLEEFIIGGEIMSIIIEFVNGNVEKMENIIDVFLDTIYGSHLIHICQKVDKKYLLKKEDIKKITLFYGEEKNVIYPPKDQK